VNKGSSRKRRLILAKKTSERNWIVLKNAYGEGNLREKTTIRQVHEHGVTRKKGEKRRIERNYNFIP